MADLKAQDGEPAPKHFRPDFWDITTVLVGKDEERFTVHTKNICDKSPLFDAACSKKWREGQDGVDKLPMVEPHVFKIYVNWIYSGKIDLEIVEHPLPMPLIQPKNPNTEQKKILNGYKSTNTFCRLYVAAKMMLDEKAKIGIIDAIQERDRQEFMEMHECSLTYLWENVQHGSGLQRWCIDAFISGNSGPTFKELGKVLPHAFIFDLAERQLEILKSHNIDCDPKRAARCSYHDHEDGKSCANV